MSNSEPASNQPGSRNRSEDDTPDLGYFGRAPLILLRAHAAADDACAVINAVRMCTQFRDEDFGESIREMFRTDLVSETLQHAEEYFGAATETLPDFAIRSRSVHHFMQSRQMLARVAIADAIRETAGTHGKSRDECLASSEVLEAAKSRLRTRLGWTEDFGDPLFPMLMVELDREFFRAWLRFFPGKPGEDFETLASASVEERERIEEQARRNPIGRPSSIRTDVERYLWFHFTRREEYSSQSDFATRLGIARSTVTVSFRRVREHFECEQPTQEQLEAFLDNG